MTNIGMFMTITLYTIQHNKVKWNHPKKGEIYTKNVIILKRGDENKNDLTEEDETGIVHL